MVSSRISGKAARGNAESYESFMTGYEKTLEDAEQHNRGMMGRAARGRRGHGLTRHGCLGCPASVYVIFSSLVYSTRSRCISAASTVVASDGRSRLEIWLRMAKSASVQQNPKITSDRNRVKDAENGEIHGQC